DGMDEISLCAPTKVSELKDGEILDYILNPQDLGFSLCTPGDLMGGDAARNAAIIRGILAGERSPALDIVLLNAGATLYVGGLAGDASPALGSVLLNAGATLYVGGLASDLKGGVAKARLSGDSGAAGKTLERWAACARSFAT